MLVDGGAIVNLMPYSLYKKLGGKDEELIKTNMTVSGVGGGDPIGAKGVASMELTVGSKTLATMGGHSGNPKISGRIIRVFEISGF